MKQIKRLQVNGTTLAYLEHGHGSALLFVHGSVADYTTFSRQVSSFSASHRCLVVSRRFHPPNDPPIDGDVYDMKEQAEDLSEFLKHTNAIPASGIGSSFGAYILLATAIRHPELFRLLVLCEPPMVPLLRYHPHASLLADEFIDTVMKPSREAFSQNDDETGLAVFVNGVRGEKNWFGRILPSMRSDLMRFAPEMKCEFLSDLSRYMMEISPEHLRNIRIPTLLIQGETTTPMFKTILDVLEECIPNTSRIEIPKAGHMSQLQNPTAWNSVVMEFLDQYSSSEGG
jgi:pimeloyl-ACP methyl ester carboxylesterase